MWYTYDILIIKTINRFRMIKPFLEKKNEFRLDFQVNPGQFRITPKEKSGMLRQRELEISLTNIGFCDGKILFSEYKSRSTNGQSKRSNNKEVPIFTIRSKGKKIMQLNSKCIKKIGAYNKMLQHISIRLELALPFYKNICIK